MKVYGLIKELQAELMTGKELPHLVSVRLLARLDDAERHLGGVGLKSTKVEAKTETENEKD
ncbi:hypothetical protein MCERE19_02267 [Spirosomataceae bacterium]|jgi:hypothetical protein